MLDEANAASLGVNHEQFAQIDDCPEKPDVRLLPQCSLQYCLPNELIGVQQYPLQSSANQRQSAKSHRRPALQVDRLPNFQSLIWPRRAVLIFGNGPRTTDHGLSPPNAVIFERHLVIFSQRMPDPIL